MKQEKRISSKLNKGNKMIIHTRARYFTFFIISLIPLILLSAVSLAAADMISENSGIYNEKIESYKQSIGMNPDDVHAHRGLGDVFSGADMYEEAVESYKQAIEINPDYTDVHYNLGVVYGNLGMYAETIKSYKQVIRIDPDYADAHSALEQYEMLKSLDPELANELFNSINE